MITTIRTNRITRSRPVAAFLLAGALLLAAALVNLAAPLPAHADRVPLEVKAEAGYQGKIKEGRWFPLQLTITNNGDDLSGELAVELASSTQGKDVTYTVPVELPSHSTKSISIALPGMNLTERNNRISFYEGNAASGKRVQILGGDLRLSAQTLPVGAYHVGVLARDPDTMNFLALLNQKGYSVTVVPLKLEDMYAEALMLDGLDALVVNDVSASEWKEEQVTAVIAWVNRGGSLILAGGAGYAKTAQPFEELSPVQATGTTALSSAGSLAAAGGAELVLDSPLTVSAGPLKEGARGIVEQDGFPLIAVSYAGLGKVWYAAYDLSLQPIASWPGNPALWETILGSELKALSALSRSSFTAAAGPGFWGISQGLEYFPNMSSPDTGSLFWVLVIYACAVGPALYFALKHWDKREWAWVAIPGLALLVSGSIYLFGAWDRNATLAQQLTMVQLNGDGTGFERSAAAVFVPKGGSYELQRAGSAYALSLGSGNNGTNTPVQMSGDSDAFISRKSSGAAIRLTGVPYWSTRKAWFVDEEPREYGSIDYTLSYDGSDWTGEFRNSTSADLHELVLFAGNEWYPVGQMDAGATLSFHQAASGRPDSDVGASPAEPSNMWHSQDVAQQLFPYQGSRDENAKYRGLLAALLEEFSQRPGTNVFLIGWSKGTGKSGLLVNGREIGGDELKLWVQPLHPQLAEGSVEP